MKTKMMEYKNNDFTNNDYYFYIPKHVQKDINEKGFHIYNWIGEKDVKMSIQRDFLKYIAKFGTIIAVLVILPSAILLYVNSQFFYIYFFGLLGTINFILILFLTVISIKRSNILRKNSHILITDTSVSINGKIRKLINNKILSNTNLKEIGNLFEEKLFEESNIHKTKKGFLKQVTNQLTKGFSTVMRMGKGGGRDSGKAVLLFLILYSIYAFSLGIVYFIGIIFISIFGILLSFINKQILLKFGHVITTINNNFENIDSDSKGLIKQKNILSKLLKDAITNDWKDSLLTKINSGIKEINNHASDAVNTSIILKKDIKKSKYKKMFNFNIYNTWIKKQIYTPLEQILELLQKNLYILKDEKLSIKNIIIKTTDPSLQGALVVSKKRIELRITEIKKHMLKISLYMKKLI